MAGPSTPAPPLSFRKLLVALLVVASIVVIVRFAEEATDDGEKDSAKPSAAGTTVPTGAVAPPRCTHADERAKDAGYDDWASTLVDTEFALKPSYVPPDLVPVARAGFHVSALVRGIVVDDLAALRVAAKKDGNPVEIAAAYRSWYTQDSLYRRRIDEEGHGVARAKTARPGHSEHQLGTAVDFETAGASDVDSTWGETREGKWMADNAWKFGFVMSYPLGGTPTTCYWYEPWHFRYFGRDKAAEMHDSGLTVRHLLWNEQR